MPRRATYSPTLVARVRAHFGLRQAELALYLGVHEGVVRHLEAGRRAPSLAVRLALLPLLPHLPAADAPTATGLPPDTPTPDAPELDFRRRICLRQAARLRAQAAQLEQQAHIAQRWAQALPTLLAAPLPDASAADAAAATTDTVARAAWRADWLGRRARPLSPAAATRWHLLRARAAALETEAAALAEALTAPAG